MSPCLKSDRRRASSMPQHLMACMMLLSTAQTHAAVLFADMNRKFSVCVSFKGGMSAWRDFLLDLEGQHNRDKRSHWLLSRHGKEARLVEDYRSFYASTATHGWFHMRFVRNPVERLVSGYLDRCMRGHMKGRGCSQNGDPTPTKLLEFVNVTVPRVQAFDEH